MRRAHRQRSETDVAAPVVAWLLDMKWDVYQEVQPSYGGNRADIVAVRNGLVWIVEAKQQFGFDVLEQAHAWLELGHCNYSSVATPKVPRKNWQARHRVLTMLGLGCFQIEGWCWNVVAPKLHRRMPRTQDITCCLRPEHKTYGAAGNAESKYFTPFKGTVKAVEEVLKARPDGLTMKELVHLVDHHYSSDRTATSSLRHWILQGTIPNVAGDAGRPQRFYYTTTGEVPPAAQMEAT